MSGGGRSGDTVAKSDECEKGSPLGLPFFGGEGDRARLNIAARYARESLCSLIGDWSFQNNASGSIFREQQFIRLNSESPSKQFYPFC